MGRVTYLAAALWDLLMAQGRLRGLGDITSSHISVLNQLGLAGRRDQSAFGLQENVVLLSGCFHFS